MLELYAHPFSSYCQKVLIALWADGTEFEYRMLDQEHPENMEELKRRWPFGLFPLLVDDGETVVETTPIIEHLQARHPGPNRWIPDGEAGRRVVYVSCDVDGSGHRRARRGARNALERLSRADRGNSLCVKHRSSQ